MKTRVSIVVILALLIGIVSVAFAAKPIAAPAKAKPAAKKAKSRR